MKGPIQILNGDALRERFPEYILGEIIVARECLVIGDVAGLTMEELIVTRSLYISSQFEGVTQADYYEKTASEYEKLALIEKGSEIFLWFEDDLFCQVNLWYIVFVLAGLDLVENAFLIRPKQLTRYGFGAYSSTELIELYNYRIPLIESNAIGALWPLFQKNDFERMLQIADLIADKLPFVREAVLAHIDRTPDDTGYGRPARSIIQIMKDLNTNEFEVIFQEFCEREPIYGFGDSQVKRLFEAIMQKSV